MGFPYRTTDITERECGRLADGTPVHLWYLANRHGMRAEVLDIGGIVSRLDVVGGDLRKHDVTLGPRDPLSTEVVDYLAGALHRPAYGPLPIMDAREEGRSVVMQRSFDRGPFAGLTVERRFALTDASELVIAQSFALADDAPLRQTPEGGSDTREASPRELPDPPLYLNLAGQEPGNVLDHAVAIDADGFVDLARNDGGSNGNKRDATDTMGGSSSGAAGATSDGPSGKAGSRAGDDGEAGAWTRDAGEAGVPVRFRDVTGTSVDFREGRPLADVILPSEAIGGTVCGFDYCLSLAAVEPTAKSPAAGASDGDIDPDSHEALGARPLGGTSRATVYCGRSRVFMDFSTDAPAVRLTTFQPAGGEPARGKGGLRYGNHSGFALVPAMLPGTPLRPGESVTMTAAYRFEPDYPEGYHTDSGCLDSII